MPNTSQNANHRILQHEKTGIWRLQLHCVKSHNPHHGNQRLNMSLKTRDVEKARLRRDLVITALGKVGMIGDTRGLEIPPDVQSNDS